MTPEPLHFIVNRTTGIITIFLPATGGDAIEMDEQDLVLMLADLRGES